jgi:ubiquinone/menaquinone biosynthesis C-methylase UbiE
MVYAEEKTAIEYQKSYQTKYRRAQALEKTLLKKLLSQFTGAKDVLEVGCGTAHFTRWLQTKGYESYGIDLSSGMLMVAKRLWSQGNLLKGESNYLPFQDKSVDIVAFITSLEFIQNPNTALIEAYRVAKKGIILGLLNKNSFAMLKRKIQQNKQEPVYSQAILYSISEIKKMLNKTIPVKYTIAWSTTVFPRILGDFDSKRCPLGDFLGVAVKLDKQTHQE